MKCIPAKTSPGKCRERVKYETNRHNALPYLPVQMPSVIIAATRKLIRAPKILRFCHDHENHEIKRPQIFWDLQYISCEKNINCPLKVTNSYWLVYLSLA